MNEKTEKPTPKKLKDARKKGQVAKSKEIPSALIITTVFMLFWITWDYHLEHFRTLMLIPTHIYGESFHDALPIVISGAVRELILLSLPVVSLTLIMAVAGNFFQIGFLFAPEVIKPEMKKVNPTEGFKRIFAMRNLIELIKSVIKISVLSIVLYLVLNHAMDDLVKLPYMGMGGVHLLLTSVMKKVVIVTCACFIVVAGLDYYLQKHQHIKQNKMSLDEVKREYKEMEGDPQIKGKRKQLHKELLEEGEVQRSRDATVLVTNPTHFAVALKYVPGETKLPRIIARGRDYLAKRMIAAAREHEVPVIRQISLARALYRRGEADHYIPRDLIKPVAEVLRWARELEQQHIKEGEI